MSNGYQTSVMAFAIFFAQQYKLHLAGPGHLIEPKSEFDQMHLTAVIHGEVGNYGISLLDLPGCISAGATLEAVLANGEAAALLHTEWMLECNEVLPLPRAVDDPRGDPEFAVDFQDAIIAVVHVPAPTSVVR
jgi:predicted RNase H-like HicB family nuclease